MVYHHDAEALREVQEAASAEPPRSGAHFAPLFSFINVSELN